MSHEYSEQGDYGAAVRAEAEWFDSLTDQQHATRITRANADSALDAAIFKHRASLRATLTSEGRTPATLLKAAQDAEAFAAAARALADVREG